MKKGKIRKKIYYRRDKLKENLCNGNKKRKNRKNSPILKIDSDTTKQ